MRDHRPTLLRLRLLLATCLLWPLGCMAATDPAVFAVGAGLQRMPNWPGPISNCTPSGTAVDRSARTYGRAALAAMNAPAMNRFFGISPQAARALSVPAWQPGAGSQLASLEYDLFMPTSRHTGVALVLVYGRLLDGAADSPLVTRYGSRTQLSESLAFTYHL